MFSLKNTNTQINNWISLSLSIIFAILGSPKLPPFFIIFTFFIQHYSERAFQRRAKSQRTEPKWNAITARGEERSPGIISTLFRGKQVLPESRMESIPDDRGFPSERIALYAIRGGIIEPRERDIRILLRRPPISNRLEVLHTSISLPPAAIGRISRRLRARLISAKAISRDTAACPEFLSRARKNQWPCRERNVVRKRVL